MQSVTESATSAVATRLFPDSTWSAISGDLALAFRMNPSEREALERNPIAKLVAAIPFLAGCEEAARTAVAHLGSYILSVRETKPYFNAAPEDRSSVFARLRLGMDFKGGDPKIIERGMSLLALDMVCDYKRDLEADAAAGKYNPLAAGDIDYQDTVERLEWTIMTTHCPEMDGILAIGAIPMAFWSD